MRQFPPVAELPVRDGLPDPFETFDGEAVETAGSWVSKRRPELRALFRHYMYGYAPEAPSLTTSVSAEYGGVLGGAATLREITIRFDDLDAGAPDVHLALFVPEDVDAAPTFLGLNKCGNHTVADCPEVRIDDEAWRHENCDGATGRGAKADFWCVDRLIERGYGFATFHESEIDTDRDAFTDGVRASYSLPYPHTSQWGTLAAWAWGLRRAVDHLETDPTVAEIGTIGHSRRGKAALLAGALDERIDLVVPHQSGTGGCALSRGNDQETVRAINESFPHWFAPKFKRFDDAEERLPFDQHLLLALVAPRPLLDTEGTRDEWANPPLAHEAVQAAAPVWELLGAEGVVGDGLLEPGEEIDPETVGSVAQYREDTGHTLTADYWDAILDFADVQFGYRE